MVARAAEQIPPGRARKLPTTLVADAGLTSRSAPRRCWSRQIRISTRSRASWISITASRPILRFTFAARPWRTIRIAWRWGKACRNPGEGLPWISKVSPKYLPLVWQILEETPQARKQEVGPIKKLQTMWLALPRSRCRQGRTSTRKVYRHAGFRSARAARYRYAVRPLPSSKGCQAVPKR